MVLAGFVTAWRLASWPTRRSPVFVKATTDGTVRPPSAEAMTVGSPPSMTATTLLVVPRSMPMILPIVIRTPVGGRGKSGSVRWFGVARRAVGARIVSSHRDERWADHPVAELVAAPDDVDDLAFGATAARDVGDRLVLARVESRTGGGLVRVHALAV